MGVKNYSPPGVEDRVYLALLHTPTIKDQLLHVESDS